MTHSISCTATEQVTNSVREVSKGTEGLRNAWANLLCLLPSLQASWVA